MFLLLLKLLCHQVDLEFFNSPEMQAFNDALDKEEGSYKERWGDANIRFAQVSLFARRDQIQCFTALNYSHICKSKAIGCIIDEDPHTNIPCYNDPDPEMD